MAWTTVHDSVAKAACDGVTPLFNSGTIKLMNSSDAELAVIGLAADAFGDGTTANPSVATAASVTADNSVTDGTIAKCEFISSTATVLLAGSAGTVGTEDLVLSSATIPSGATSVTFSALTFSVSAA